MTQIGPYMIGSNIIQKQKKRKLTKVVCNLRASSVCHLGGKNHAYGTKVHEVQLIRLQK